MTCIMFVDDCDDLRSLFRRAFERELGIEVLALRSLSEVKKHEKEVLNCSAAILDINLGAGEPSGVDIHDWLKAQAYKGSIFFFTGHGKESPMVQKAAKTQVPILEKPMAPADLISIIKGSLS